MDRRALQDGADDRGRDRDPGGVRRGVPARGNEEGAAAHVCDEDLDAATVRKLSKRGPHVPTNVHQDLQARRGTTAGQGSGEGIDTASDPAHLNTRLSMEEAAVGGNPGEAPLRPAKLQRKLTKSQRKNQQQKRNRHKKAAARTDARQVGAREGAGEV